ncbi:MAG TPA: hypothetical protein VFG54_10940 [Prolixibacteraceae bacterium]|nr:hypothetical protein [Prolixibacteraceae bacterium]
MKKTLLYLLMLLPAFAFGQLFPKVGDFRGRVSKITERRYGKELNTYKKDSGVFRPKEFSGWEYIYEFDENSRLVKRTNLINEVVDAAYTYEREESGDRQIEREIIHDNNNQRKGDYLEYENFLNAEGKVEKVNYWSYKARDNKRELFLVEKDARYEQGRLVSYTRHAVKEDGEMDTGELCSLVYDSFGRLILMERKDIITGFKTILYYHYNRRGMVSQFTIDYMVGLRNDQNTQKQDIYYKYDRRGNWTRRYWVSDKKRRLEDKRKIKYH